MNNAEFDAMDREMEEEAMVRTLHRGNLQPIKESHHEGLEDYLKTQRYLENKIKHYREELDKINDKINEAKNVEHTI